MISFIIVGRNEGWKLTKCFESIFRSIEKNRLKDYEIIYVDSDSTDDSIERAKSFNGISIYLITGSYNAAIARNIGAKEAKGDVLFFIDGDMEIIPEFLPLVYEKNVLKHNFVSGQVKHFNYDINGIFLSKSYQFKKLKKDKIFYTTGGIFLIKKNIWKKVKGMDINFKKGEDHDLALTLIKNGYPLLRKKDIIANHYTIQYLHKHRIWKTIFSGDISYSNSFLLRKHFFNKYIYKKIINSNYTTIAMIVFFIVTLITHNLYSMIGYIFFLSIKLFKNRKENIFRNIELLSYYILRDLAFIFYFLFVPMKKVSQQSVTYIQV